MKRTSKMALAAASVVVLAGVVQAQSLTDHFVVSGGTLQLQLDAAALRSISAVASSDEAVFQFGADGDLTIGVGDVEAAPFARFMGGMARSSGQLSLMTAGGAPIAISGLALMHTPGGSAALSLVDMTTGETLFEIAGESVNFDYDASTLTIGRANLLASEYLAALLGYPDAAHTPVGTVSVSAVTRVTDTLPLAGIPQNDDAVALGGFPTTGPDVIVCDLPNLIQFGRMGAIGSGTIGLGLATTSANKGNVTLDWYQMPQVFHPVIGQNLYRLKTVNGSTRFEQIGQSWVKHGFCALQLPQCFACTPFGGGCNVELGVGCSDPYDASLNATQARLGPRSFINPWTGVYPNTAQPAVPPGTTPIDRRLQVRDADLMGQPAGTLYYAEGQYVARDDSTAGNQLNNVSYRRVNVSGPNGSGVFSLPVQGGTIIEASAISVWATATQVLLNPTPGSDGQGILAYQVTDLSGSGSGPWHYEYAVYNMNIEAAIRSLSIPVPNGVTLSNVEQHFPLNHGIQNTGSAFSNNPWTFAHAGGIASWSTDTFAANVNANAIRWGTVYNFRFDANTPPAPATATVGLYKAGGATTATVLAPSGVPGCVGDLDGDGDTDLGDLGIVLAAFGVNAGGDLDGDGDTDLGDLGIILANFPC